MSRAYQASWLAGDLRASLNVCFVALPLCLGVAIASGAPPIAGLISGMIGGLLVGLASGAPLQVTGPAAGLIALTAPIIFKHGMAGVAAVCLWVGLAQLVAGALRLGQRFERIPKAVTGGMLAGIGGVVIATQLPLLIGGVAIAHPRALFSSDWLPHGFRAGPAFVALVTFAVLIFWNKAAPRLRRVLPAPLMAALVALALAVTLPLGTKGITLPAQFAFETHLPDWGLMFQLDIIGWAIAMWFVASAEALLSAIATQQIEPRATLAANRELVAQGLGNVACSVLGGLPLTGVIVRNHVNIESGARTRVATVLQGGWILAATILLARWLERVPVSCLAALLVYVGFKLLFAEKIQLLLRSGRGNLTILIATAISVVLTDLVIGVVIGLVFAACRFLLKFRTGIERCDVSGTTHVNLIGIPTPNCVVDLEAALRDVPANGPVRVHLARTFLTRRAWIALADWRAERARDGGDVQICVCRESDACERPKVRRASQGTQGQLESRAVRP